MKTDRKLNSAGVLRDFQASSFELGPAQLVQVHLMPPRGHGKAADGIGRSTTAVRANLEVHLPTEGAKPRPFAAELDFNSILFVTF